MSFEFQSTLVNVTPQYRIAGNQIGGLRIEYKGDVKVARLVVTNDRDITFSLSPLFTPGDPDAIYAALATDLYEVTEGVLLNEGAIGKVVITADKIIVDLEGSDLPFEFVADAEAAEAKEVQDHLWALPPAGFAALTTAAAAWRSSLDGSLEGLSEAITQEVADRIAAITAEEQRVDALIASGMWLFADQASFPSAADNHGRVVHSHADGAIFYAHGGMWHQVAKEVDLQTTIDSVANEATARVAADDALSGRLDVLEADPTTATAVAAGDAATLSSANTYTDGEIATEASARTSADASLSGRLDVLEADPTTATAVAAVQADVDQNESDSDAADAALSARLDVLEADPTTATAVAAVQSDVDQNEADGDAADAALSGRLDVLEADPTTATAVAAVQSDVDQNEADADAALALKAPLADPDFTGQLEVDVNLRLEYDSSLTKIHNVLRGTSIEIGNNIQMKPATAGGRVEIAGGLQVDITEVPEYSNDTQAAAGGIIVGGIYRSGSVLHIRVS